MDGAQTASRKASDPADREVGCGSVGGRRDGAELGRKRPREPSRAQISVEVANTQMKILRDEVKKGFTRTAKGSELAEPKEPVEGRKRGDPSR